MLQIEEEPCTRFAPLFSKGVGIQARTGCSIAEFVNGQLGISQEYLEERIQTIFLDGKPVDDHHTAKVGHGSMLALSAAMPGLVGAIMRRGGHLAAMRKSITHTADTGEACKLDGWVTVKLFNLTARELGVVLLRHGILIASDDLTDAMKRFENSFRNSLKSISYDDEMIDYERLLVRLGEKDSIFLKIETVS